MSVSKEINKAFCREIPNSNNLQLILTHPQNDPTAVISASKIFDFCPKQGTMLFEQDYRFCNRLSNFASNSAFLLLMSICVTSNLIGCTTEGVKYQLIQELVGHDLLS